MHRGLPDGRQTYCRECFAARYRERRERDGHMVRPADVPDGHKYCRGCRRVKRLSEWAPRRAGTDGYAFRCRECISRRDRQRHLVASYGLDEAAVALLLESQGGLCAICQLRRAIHVDHDHATGAVRGMLCFSCNAALGHFRDDPAVLRRAARYLERSASVPAGAARDEAAWAAVLHGAPSDVPSRLEDAFRVRLAEETSGPTS